MALEALPTKAGWRVSHGHKPPRSAAIKAPDANLYKRCGISMLWLKLQKRGIRSNQCQFEI